MCSKRFRELETGNLVTANWIVAGVYSLIILATGCSAVPFSSVHVHESSHQAVSELTQDELACAEQDEWINQPPRVSGQVSGVGSAEIRYEPLAKAIKRAKENARAEVSKQLAVVISAETKINTERNRTDTSSSFASHLREKITSSAPEIELVGVEIIDTCVDRLQRTVYALATLNRTTATDGLLQQLGRLDTELGRFASIPTNQPRTEQLRQLLPALELIHQSDQLEETLHRVSGFPAPSAPQRAALERRINELIDRLTILLRPQGQDAVAIRSLLTKYLLGKGLRVNSRGTADLIVEYGLSTRSVKDSGIYFVYAQGEIVVKDAKGRTVNTLDARVKEGSPIGDAHARDKATQALGKQLGDLLSKTLLTRL